MEFMRIMGFLSIGGGLVLGYDGILGAEKNNIIYAILCVCMGIYMIYQHYNKMAIYKKKNIIQATIVSLDTRQILYWGYDNAVTASYEKDGKSFLFKNENHIGNESFERLTVGDKINVYVDPKDYHKYIMELEILAEKDYDKEPSFVLVIFGGFCVLFSILMFYLSSGIKVNEGIGIPYYICLFSGFAFLIIALVLFKQYFLKNK